MITIVPPTINTNRRSMITPAKVPMIIAEPDGDPEDRTVGSGVVGIEQSPTWKSEVVNMSNVNNYSVDMNS